jgi:hypothetical protein
MCHAPDCNSLCFAGATLLPRLLPTLAHTILPRRPRMAATSPASRHAAVQSAGADALAAQPAAISALRNVSYAIGGVSVVEGVSLDLIEGEIVAILGPSGSGKRYELPGIALPDMLSSLDVHAILRLRVFSLLLTPLSLFRYPTTSLAFSQYSLAHPFRLGRANFRRRVIPRKIFLWDQPWRVNRVPDVCSLPMADCA